MEAVPRCVTCYTSRDMKTRIVLVLYAASGFLLHAQDAAGLYKESCAMCHDGGEGRAPGRDALRSMTPQRVLAAMETGPMISMAVRRSAAERRAIAEYVTGKSF